MARPRSQPWWKYVPHRNRAQRAWMVRRLQFGNLLVSRRFWLVAALLLYGVGCVLLLGLQDISLALLALAPLLLLPLLGYVVYWLLWKEFHE